MCSVRASSLKMPRLLAADVALIDNYVLELKACDCGSSTMARAEGNFKLAQQQPLPPLNHDALHLIRGS